MWGESGDEDVRIVENFQWNSNLSHKDRIYTQIKCKVLLMEVSSVSSTIMFIVKNISLLPNHHKPRNFVRYTCVCMYIYIYITLETERIKGSNPWCLWWWWHFVLSRTDSFIVYPPDINIWRHSFSVIYRALQCNHISNGKIRVFLIIKYTFKCLYLL